MAGRSKHLPAYLQAILLLFDCKLEFLESFLVNVGKDERVTHRLAGLHQLDFAELFFGHYVLEHRTVGIVVYQTQLVGEWSYYERIVCLIGYRLELIPIGIGFVKDIVEPNACRLVGGQLASVGVEDSAVGVDKILGAVEYFVKGHKSLYSMSASDLMSLSTFVLGSATSRS